MTTTVLSILAHLSKAPTRASKTTSLFLGGLLTSALSVLPALTLSLLATTSNIAIAITASTAIASEDPHHADRDDHSHHEANGSHGDTSFNEINKNEFNENESKPLKPASRYSGSTPIDLSHGLLMSNGTYGEPNPDYVSWSTSPTIAVNISEKTYPYSEKASFCRHLTERLAFFEAAIQNWNQVSPITKPEAVEYAKNAVQTITPKLETALASLKSAKSAGQADWNQAQAGARRSLLALQATYYQLHRNPAMK